MIASDIRLAKIKTTTRSDSRSEEEAEKQQSENHYFTSRSCYVFALLLYISPAIYFHSSASFFFSGKSI
jgi:hypothetical protein